jgi:hypothetical protein
MSAVVPQRRGLWNGNVDSSERVNKPVRIVRLTIRRLSAAGYWALLLGFLLLEVLDFFTFFFVVASPGSVGAGVSGCVACASAGPAPIARLMLKMDAARSVRIVILLR